ncbi:MAG: 5'-nucleotidase C-terminal domain-containing protein, partial [Hungatella sp.]
YNTYKDGDVTVSFNPKIRPYNYDMFSGINYEVNISKEPGNRIENVTRADGSKLKDQDEIIVAVNNYCANTQLASYGPIFKEGEKLPVILEKNMLSGSGIRELIGKYIKEVKKGVIKPQLSNNWKLTGTNWSAEDHAAAAKLVNDDVLTIPVSEDGRTPNVKAITTEDIKEKLRLR